MQRPFLSKFPLALSIITILCPPVVRSVGAQVITEKDTCEHYLQAKAPKFTIVRKQRTNLKEGALFLYISIAPPDATRDNMLAVACSIGKNHADEKALFVYIFDNLHAAKRYNPQGEGNDKATISSYLGMYGFSREDANSFQGLDLPDPGNSRRLTHIDLGPPPIRQDN
jgi:hypothetical protein